MPPLCTALVAVGLVACDTPVEPQHSTRSVATPDKVSQSLTPGPSTALTSTLLPNVVLTASNVPGLNRPWAVNDAGWVVGDYGGNNIAAFWTETGGFQSIGRLDNGSTDCCSSLLAVNNLGEAVGFSHTAGGVVATSYTRASGSYTELGVSGRPYAHAINENGEIVGLDATGNTTAWYKPSGGAFMYLPRGLWPYSMDATGINNSGRIVGVAYTFEGVYAVVWPAHDQEPIELPSLGGDQSSFLTAINAAGDVVGWSTLVPGGPHHATLWPASGGIVDLSTWQGGCSGESEAAAINVDGVIGGKCNGQPVVWTGVEGQRSLPLMPGVSSAQVTGMSRGHIVGIANGFGSIQWTVSAPNVPPVAALSPSFATITEGGSVSFDAGASLDSDGQIQQYEWSWNGGATFDPSATGATVVHQFAQDGSYTVTVRVTDNAGGAATKSAAVTVNNVLPTVSIGGVSLSPIALTQGLSIPVTVGFSDPGTLDQHAIFLDCDNGTGPATLPPSGNGACAVSAAGVYTLTATVTDDHGSVSATSLAVVYDPSSGFVTGGGWIASPAGACQLTLACQSTTGKATFGYVSKYQQGATTPSGNTEFQFNAGVLSFSSTSYDWLVVSGAKAQFKGSGMVNGQAGYDFLLTATDGDRPGGGGVDKLRMKIWLRSTGTIVYDNVAGTSTDIDAATPQAIGAGSITIHP